MLIKGNSGALASVVSGDSGGASAPAAVAVVNGGGDVSGVTLKTPDKAMVTLEWIPEISAWACELPQDLVEGGDVIVTVSGGVVSITCS